MSPDETSREARALYDNGLYCAEAVLLAVAKAQDIESDLLPALATGFCGGLSRTSGPCGAVTGAIMGLGLAYGRDRGGESVDQAYAATRALIARFTHEFNSTDCSALLGCDLGTEDGRRSFNEQNLSERCRGFSGAAARIAAEILNDPSCLKPR